MLVFERGGGAVLSGVKHFNIVDTFECGQCFRWDRQEDGSYIGVAKGRVLSISQQGTDVFLRGATIEDYKTIWERYFDLARDYGKIQKVLSCDKVLKRAIEFGGGIRILAQDPFEVLISFIISANNHIPRIKQIIFRLCESYGEPIELEGRRYYSFPTPETIAELSLEDLKILRAGYRDKYILEAAKMVASGSLDLGKLYSMPYHKAKAELMKVKGVGEKVANCILLYGFGRHEAFPVDVWVRRMAAQYYGACSKADIDRVLCERFGLFGGFAQQYLFYYARELKIAK